jgi:iron complex transport system permease protein
MALQDGMARERAVFSLARLRERHLAGDRGPLALVTIALLLFGSVLSLLFSVTTGASDASFLDVIADAAGSADPLDVRGRIIIVDIRMPRAILGFLVGGSLAVSGAVMQGLFRNPLADPGLVGVSSGAGLGAVPLHALLGIYALPIAAFGGGLLTTLLLCRMATSNGHTSVATMLLAGIALGSLAAALTGLLIYMANDQQLRDLTFWGMGSLAGATWSKIGAAAPIVLLSFAAIPFIARGLNALTLGEAAAFHMGVPVHRLKNIAIVSVAATTGASVAVSGGIGFVGIVVPHILRMAIGPDHRFLLPASALLGGSLLIVADVLARTVVAPAELPIGIITAAVGGPFFLWIVLRQRARLAL